MRLRLLLTALLALSLSACSGGDSGSLTDEGYRALSSNNPTEALAKFEAALSKMQPADPRYVETKLGELRARAYGDPRDAKEKPMAGAAVVEFLAVAKTTEVRADDYRMLVSDLASAGAFTSASDVLMAGKDAYPDDPKWTALIQKVGDAASAAGDVKARSALDGLGYIGND